MGDPTQADARRDIVAAEALLDWSVDRDGRGVTLGLLTEAGGEVALSLPAQSVPQATMALLALLTELHRRGASDIMHPVAGWRLEGVQAPDHRLLTLTTTEGFRLTFLLLHDELDAIALASASAVPTAPEVTH
ncbi:hypothetical protein ACQW02_07050 [Humitalea sp. 24SJ18S-53]|uniref:hypothetical protein n=1 Tax=Humitalea sp. 24SJ18S-53 TaxID=3422307 RepID=UPI003D677ED8